MITMPGPNHQRFSVIKQSRNIFTYSLYYAFEFFVGLETFGIQINKQNIGSKYVQIYTSFIILFFCFRFKCRIGIYSTVLIIGAFEPIHYLFFTMREDLSI